MLSGPPLSNCSLAWLQQSCVEHKHMYKHYATDLYISYQLPLKKKNLLVKREDWLIWRRHQGIYEVK